MKKEKKSQAKLKVGILGGAFNPIHSGHLNSALTVRQKLKLGKVLLVPALHPPHRELNGPGPQDRLDMVRAAIKPYEDELELDDREIRRGGTSYSVLSLRELNRIHSPKELYFIMGVDAFKDFPKWKEFNELLKLSNFVVTTRPGHTLSLLKENLPDGLQEHAKTTTDELVKLSTGLKIIKIELEDIEISATDIRKKLKVGHNVSRWLPLPVLNIIKERGLYKGTLNSLGDPKEFSKVCSTKALDKKALNLKIYDMTRKNEAFSDYSVICSATSHRHASSIANGILDSVKDELGLRPLSVEGLQGGEWVLIDYGSVVIHVFQGTAREHYSLEALWKKCPQVEAPH